MSAQERGHTHAKKVGGPDDGAGPDWFRVLDVVIWVSVAAIAVMGIEWLIGRAIRESIAASASRYLKKTAATSANPEA
jgi:hypothetical protein